MKRNFGPWFTTANPDGTITVHNWNQPWRAGQVVGNPLRERATCPLDKTSRRFGYTPPPNHLHGARLLEVIYAGQARAEIDNGDGWVARASGTEVQVRIVG